MNARPTVQFKHRLAGHLGKTIAEIDAMDSREFSAWIAWSRWFRPLDDSWVQAGTMLHYLLIPHMGGRTPPEPKAFVPLEDKAPKHPTQIRAILEQMKKDLDG